jgi:CheY-like chemotaxis protein
MPHGGRLTIESANLAIRKPDADQFGEIKPGNYVAVSITDTGTGIAADVMDKVFDPFFSTKPAARGAGLGLSMVYGFITQSGGHVRLSSGPGRGTTVRLYLPSVGAPKAVMSPPPQAGIPSRPELPGGREQILVVEDAAMVRDYTTSVLTSLGYDVAAAEDGRSALALLDTGMRPDMLLTDVLLPDGMDGIALAAEIRQRRPGIAMLYMSGYVENVDAFQGQLDPHANLLLKPFARSALASMVRRQLDQV